MRQTIDDRLPQKRHNNLLEQNASANLQLPHARARGDDAERRGAAHRRARSVQVDEVEDVRGFAAELELDALIDSEVAKPPSR